MTTQIVAGDDVSFTAQLYKDEATFTIDPGATVRAMLVSLNHNTAYTTAATLSAAASGADWANSLVVVEMADTVTAGITYQGHACIEIEVDDTIKETWFGEVQIITGNIS